MFQAIEYFKNLHILILLEIKMSFLLIYELDCKVNFWSEDNNWKNIEVCENPGHRLMPTLRSALNLHVSQREVSASQGYKHTVNFTTNCKWWPNGVLNKGNVIENSKKTLGYSSFYFTTKVWIKYIYSSRAEWLNLAVNLIV